MRLDNTQAETLTDLLLPAALDELWSHPLVTRLSRLSQRMWRVVVRFWSYRR
ncbi:hypothetical protein [Streptomyces sp. 8L]|uniref:hypothetical protein n=1 Tax=Streptomyces sp. 8L TaxID=2877242 RepID=UPI001CD21628|nr:hypothetical protein [Streptomyces sp. 8L]MCA1219854.1 hypothetical protein [Streptomyces sp. 8L]